MELQSSRLTYPTSSKEKICQTRTTYSAKLSLKNEDKIKTTPDKQKPKFVAIKPILQNITGSFSDDNSNWHDKTECWER